MSTCKECEHYEKYDGREKTLFNDKAIMYCPKLKGLDDEEDKSSNGYSSTTNACHINGYFTPKPKEPERKCENCGRRGESCIKLVAKKLRCSYTTGLKYWQPIPKEKPKEPPKTISPEEYASESARRRAKEPAKPAISYDEVPLDERSCLGCWRSYRHDNTCKDQPSGHCDDDYSGWQPKEPKKPKPIKKEKTMKIGIFKFSVRRYMVLCTALVTARIAVWLNPLVYWFWHLMPGPPWGTGKEVCFWDHVFPWMLTITAIAAVYVILLSWNRLSVWIFGEKK